ncbi:hypothetical protein FC36_GL001863 [Ligilactobacillus equi DSM 15833 = JCM 10991]|uniref:Uncharacterized protein n=1 Tax=Ligilactobacillus equi DSM 15833 = JCM 10991 TaxID=1423740 RepID=A0A0R1T5N0_9LACO|nr:hypothetical protein FC36_GL001863 [Ligilactobacillus equi DSM 15833 = JCM 10991]
MRQETKLKAQMLAKDGFKELNDEPPTYLTGYAREEYLRVIPEIKKLPVRDMDLATVCLYCTWYAAYREILELIENVPDQEERVASYAYLDRVTKNIKGLTSDLGLTVDSRMRINTGILNSDKEDKPKTMKEMFG